MSVLRKRLSTALPKEPVPPVISKVLLVNRDIVCLSPFEILNITSFCYYIYDMKPPRKYFTYLIGYIIKKAFIATIAHMNSLIHLRSALLLCSFMINLNPEQRTYNHLLIHTTFRYIACIYTSCQLMLGAVAAPHLHKYLLQGK